MNKLFFSAGNAKLSTAIANFSLPAGHTCPFAKDCLSCSDRLTGKITDGKDAKFRCFAATSEARATTVRVARWNNFEALKKARSVERMGKLIQSSLPAGLDIIRIHVSGDFFSEIYFLAWLNVAKNNPHKTFYGYTKAIPFLVKYRRRIPKNFRLTASFGGKFDALIKIHKLRSAVVVFSVDEAKKMGLEIDHDDSRAIQGNKDFALLIHGTQIKGSAASIAWSNLIKAGIGGYSKKVNKGRNRSVKPAAFKVFVNIGTETKKTKGTLVYGKA